MQAALLFFKAGSRKICFKPKYSPMADRSETFFSRTKSSALFRSFDRIHFLISVLIILVNLTILFSSKLERIEKVFLDYFFRQRPALNLHPDIVIIEIEEDSLHTIGAWPWPWAYHANMIRLLGSWGAKAVVFDFPFRESEGNDHKAELEEAIRFNGNVYTSVSLEPKLEKKIWVHSLPVVLEPKSDEPIWVHSAASIEKSAKGIGHNVILPDSDGVTRSFEPVEVRQGQTFWHVGMKVAADLTSKNFEEAYLRSVPRNPEGHVLINWAGPSKQTFKRFIFSDIIRSSQFGALSFSKRVNPSDFKGKICLIGTTAAEITRYVASPFETNVPSLWLQANILNQLLMDQYLRAAPIGLNAVVLIMIGAVSALFFSNFRNLPSFVTGLGLGILWSSLSGFLFIRGGYWLYIFHPLLLILELFIFSAIYHQINSAKEQVRLFDLATRDGLTGLYVIRHFREILNRVVLEANVTREPICLILLDIDHFKKINDTYGHPAGDRVLKETAAVIQSVIRQRRPPQEVDYIGRYGGEEFIVLVRRIALQKAVQLVAERIRTIVENKKIEWEGKSIPVTVSLGVASLHPGEKVPDAMVHRADAALYRSKNAGRNRVTAENKSDG